MKWWDIIKALREQQNKQSQPEKGCAQPISHQLIQRSEEDEAEFLKWKETDCKEKILLYISKNYNTWQTTTCEQCDAIDFLKLPSFRGFVIHFMDLKYDCNEVKYLFDYLKEKVLTLGYKVQVSDERVFEKAKWLEKTERHYLKPVVKIKANEKIEQRFGNINIELKFRDDEPMHLKFAAATYHDCQFKNAEEFQELMKYITA